MTRARATAGALLGVLLALPLAGRAQAQNAVLTGKVTTEFGQPLEGANVYITEMSFSVGTNAQGVYSITIPAARVSGQQVILRVRSFGFVPQMKPVRITAGSQSFDFALKQDVNRLQEVVVTGVTAGTEQKKLAFTVARVDESQMPVQGSNALSQLQGKVPGAQIVQTTGRPGATASVLLRGPKSINGSGRGQEPLYIVDGVELQGGLGDLNPADIESVEVVKGAAASSLYGARAGNGVISVTTKSGKNAGEGIRFNARTEYGVADIEREFPLPANHFLMMNETKTRFCTATTVNAQTCDRTVDLAQEALRINENAQDVSLDPALFVRDGGIASTLAKPLLRGTFQVEQYPVLYDPVGQLVTQGNRSNTTVDASGRVGQTNFFTSLNSYTEQGAIRYLNGYKRNSVRLNVDQNIGSDWSFGIRSYYARASSDGGNAENGTGFFRLTRTPRGINLLATDKFGRLFIRSNPLNQGYQNDNPLYWFQNARQMDKNDRFIGTLTSRYAPLSWLDFDGNFSYDRTNGSTYYQRDLGFRTTGNSPNNPLGFFQYNSGFNQSLNSGVSANAHKSWGELNTRYTARYLYEQQDFDNAFYYGNTLAVPQLMTGDNVTLGQTVSSGQSSIRSIGMMGGIDADWKERYIVGALYRRDGSSLFGAQNRWANYGRGSLAWRIAAEPWWFAPSLINELKLRASVGTAGGRPRFSGQYETFSIGAGGVLNPLTLGNKKLMPETVMETELGFDAEIMSRYGLTVNYAKASATDQILPVTPPSITGFDSQWRNLGTLENKTWEASLNVPIIQKRNVNWSARVNYDHTKSVITKLAVPPFFTGTGQQGTEGMFRMAQGETYGTLYGRKFATSCSELPSYMQGKCGSGKDYQKNNEGFIVWVGQGNTPADGITKNLWQAMNVGCLTSTGARISVSTANAETVCKGLGGTVNTPWGVANNWGMPIILRDSAGNALKVPLGHVLPDFRLGLSQTFNYRKFFVYGALDGSYGQSVWNEGRHWSLGDFMNKEQDQGGKSVGDAKPAGYYWRAPSPDNGNGVGGFYDILGPNSVSVEKASYMKLREVNLSYNVGAVRGVGDWTISFTGRNLKTWTDYKGFDPEVGLTNVGTNVTGSSALAAVDAYNFPNFRTFTFGIGTKF